MPGKRRSIQQKRTLCERVDEFFDLVSGHQNRSNFSGFDQLMFMLQTDSELRGVLGKSLHYVLVMKKGQAFGHRQLLKGVGPYRDACEDDVTPGGRLWQWVQNCERFFAKVAATPGLRMDAVKQVGLRSGHPDHVAYTLQPVPAQVLADRWNVACTTLIGFERDASRNADANGHKWVKRLRKGEYVYQVHKAPHIKKLLERKKRRKAGLRGTQR